MADQGSATSLPTHSNLSSSSLTELTIHTPLKFLISNLKNLVPTILTNENYAIWHLQLLQHFSANEFNDHLTGISVCPPETFDAGYNTWKLIDRNLLSAILSTISHSVLPYVLSLASAHEVWDTLERRLQPTSESRVIQLKNELHQIQMQNQTMQ